MPGWQCLVSNSNSSSGTAHNEHSKHTPPTHLQELQHIPRKQGGDTLAHSPAQKQGRHLSISEKLPLSILAGYDQTRLQTLLSLLAQVTVSLCRKLKSFLHPLGKALCIALLLLQKQMSIQPRATGRHVALLTSPLLQCWEDTDSASPKNPTAGSEMRPHSTGTPWLLSTKTRDPGELREAHQKHLSCHHCCTHQTKPVNRVNWTLVVTCRVHKAAAKAAMRIQREEESAGTQLTGWKRCRWEPSLPPF